MFSHLPLPSIETQDHQKCNDYFLSSIYSTLFCSYFKFWCQPRKKMDLTWRIFTWQNHKCIINQRVAVMIKVMRLHQDLYLECLAISIAFRPIVIWYYRRTWCVRCVPWWWIIWHDIYFRLFTVLIFLHRLCENSTWISYST